MSCFLLTLHVRSSLLGPGGGRYQNTYTVKGLLRKVPVLTVLVVEPKESESPVELLFMMDATWPQGAAADRWNRITSSLPKFLHSEGINALLERKRHLFQKILPPNLTCHAKEVAIKKEKEFPSLVQKWMREIQTQWLPKRQKRHSKKKKKKKEKKIILPNYQRCLVGWGCRIHRLLLSRRVKPHQRVSWIWTLNDLSEFPVMLELGGMRRTPSLPSLLGPLWPWVVASKTVLSMCQIELNYVLMLNWIAWNRTILNSVFHLNCLLMLNWMV